MTVRKPLTWLRFTCGTNERTLADGYMAARKTDRGLPMILEQTLPIGPLEHP
jgi:hypothetical protein